MIMQNLTLQTLWTAEFSPRDHPKMLTIAQQKFSLLGLDEGKYLVHANSDRISCGPIK